MNEKSKSKQQVVVDPEIEPQSGLLEEADTHLLKYKTLIDNNLFGIWRIDFDVPISIKLPHQEIARLILDTGYFGECNDLLVKMYGFMAEQEFLGKRVKEIVADRKEFIKRLVKVSGQNFEIKAVETKELDAHGKIKYFRNSYFGKIKYNKLQWLWGFQLDVTREVLAEQKMKKAQMILKNREERLRNILRSAADGIIVTDGKGIIDEVNNSYLQISGMTRMAMVGRSIFESLAPMNQEKVHDIIAEIETSSKIIIKEFEIFSGPSKGRIYEATIAPIINDEGLLVNFVAVLRDISVRKLKEAAFKQIAREKEILLKEAHHRVKNNFTIVSSLLMMQSKQITDPNDLELFIESRNRIQMLANLHDILHQSSDVNFVSMERYLSRIINDLALSYKIDQEQVKLELDIAKLKLDSKAATSCGLILNELFTNAVKYGFSNGEKGVIRVVFRKTTGKKVQLKVSNTGRKLPAEFNIEDTHSFGLKIVKMLSEQLEAKLEVEMHPETSISLIFSPVFKK